MFLKLGVFGVTGFQHHGDFHIPANLVKLARPGEQPTNPDQLECMYLIEPQFNTQLRRLRHKFVAQPTTPTI